MSKLGRGYNESRLRACGLIMPFADVEIWDEDNKPLPLGRPGQIVARADGQMTGFWNDPEGTKQRMVDMIPHRRGPDKILSIAGTRSLFLASKGVGFPETP